MLESRKRKSMPSKDDRKAFNEAIRSKNQDQIRQLLQQDDAKEFLLTKDDDECLPIHDACIYAVDRACLQLILDAAVEHVIAKEMLEEKDGHGSTCLHSACSKNLSPDSLRLLLEYFSKYTDIKKILEEKTNCGLTCLHLACDKNLFVDSFGLLLEYLAKHADIKRMLEEKTDHGFQTCLHLACDNFFSAQLSTDSFRLLLEYSVKYADIKKMLEEKNKYGYTCLHLACWKDLSPESLRLLISFFPSKSLLATLLDARNNKNETPIDHAKIDEVKQLLQEKPRWRVTSMSSRKETRRVTTIIGQRISTCFGTSTGSGRRVKERQQVRMKVKAVLRVRFNSFAV